jgi:hypothetical protein
MKGGCGIHAVGAVFNHWNVPYTIEGMMEVVTFKPGIGLWDRELGLLGIHYGLCARIYTLLPLLNSDVVFDDYQENLRGFITSYQQSRNRFLEMGGSVNPLAGIPALIKETIDRDVIPIVGVSRNIIYGRQEKKTDTDTDKGHFIIVKGYDEDNHTYTVFDPAGIYECYQGTEYKLNMTFLESCVLRAKHTLDSSIIILERKDEDK